MADKQDAAKFPCSLTIHIPFPNHRLASAAIRTLSVDQELSSLVRRSFSLVASSPDDGADAPRPAGEASLEDDGGAGNSILRSDYSATTNRMLRVAVNGFFESLGTVIQTMEELDLDVVHEKGLESLEGAQGVEEGLTGSFS